MHLTGKNLFQRIFFLVIAGVLIFSLMLVSACGKGNSTDNGEEDPDPDPTTETVWKPISNNDFTDLYDTSDSTTYNPRVPKDWSFSGDYADSSSNKAPDSSGADTRYGTVSVTEENWAANQSKYLAQSVKDWNAKEENKENPLELPNPRTLLYNLLKEKNEDYWKRGDDDKLLTDETGFYNGADKYAEEGKITRDDDKLLMIAHLKYDENNPDSIPGTATRYKSSQITVQANSVMKITVRINTMYFNSATGTFGRFPHLDEGGYNTLDANVNPDGKSLGATLSLTGGVEDALTISGIDTDCQWREFTFYIKGDPSSAKNVYLELGLGSGDKTVRDMYTGGYAFFDNIETEFLSLAEFDGQNLRFAEGYRGNLDGETTDTVLKSRTYRSYNDNSDWTSKNAAYYDFHFQKSDDGIVAAGGWLTGGSGVDAQLNSGYRDADTYKFGDDAVDAAAKDTPFIGNLYGIHNKVANTKLTSSMGKSFTLPVLQENTFYRVSLWLKTSDFKDVSGVNLYLVNRNNTAADAKTQYVASLTDVDTTDSDLDKEELDKPENEYLKILNGWRQYSFYIKGAQLEGSVKNLDLQVWFGPVAGSPVDTAKYPDAYGKTKFALFTEPTVEVISQSYYSSASSAENIATYDLSTTESTTVTNGGFTSLASYADPEKDKAEITQPSGWTYTGGLAKDPGSGENRYNLAPAGPENMLTGVLNKNNYTNGKLAGALTKLGLANAQALKDLLDNDGNADNSALLMYANGTAYGFKSSSITVPANSIYRIQFRAYYRGNGSFYAYLTDDEGKVVTADLTVPKKDEDGKEVEGETVTVNDEKDLQFKLTNNADWQTYCFYIRTGAKAKTVTLEFWAGSRFLAEGEETASTTYTTGAALFDDVTYVGKSKTEVTASITEDQKAENARLDESLFETPKKNAAEGNREFGIDEAKFFDYKEIDLKEEEEDKDNDSDDEEDTTPAASNFGWLDIATLVLALALVFAVGAIAYKQIRSSKFVQKRKMKKAQAQAKHRSYDRKNAKPVVKRPDGTVVEDEDLTDDGTDVEVEEPEGSEFDEDLEAPVEGDLEAMRADAPDEAETIEAPDELAPKHEDDDK